MQTITSSHALQAIFGELVRGIAKKLGVRNDRVKVKSQESLIKICRCTHIGPGVISRSLFEQEDDTFVKSFNGPSMVGLLRFLVSMVSEFGVNDDTQLVPDKLMRLIVPALESKHLDVRTIGTELYAALYNNVGDAADYMNGLISHLSARMKNQLTDAVSRLRPADAALVSSTSPAKKEKSPTKQKRNSIAKVDVAMVTLNFGEDVAKKLASDGWQGRADALRDLSNRLQWGEALVPTADSSKAWDICCRVVKQGIMSNFVTEILQALRLLRTLANADPSMMELSIPWSAWEARLVLGSIVKSVIDRINDRHVRVRESAEETAIVIAQSNSVGLTLVARHALAEVAIPKVNPSSPLSQRRAYGLVGNNLVHRLRIVKKLVQDYKFTMQCTLLTLESVLKHVLQAWRHKSALVATTCKALCNKAMHIAGADTALHYISTLPVEAQVKLRPLLPQMNPKQLDVERSMRMKGDGEMIPAEHGGSVRGPQFSPISTNSHGLGGAQTFPGADLESASFNSMNLPTSGRIRPRRRSRFRENRDNMSSAPDSVNARMMHEAPTPPSSAPFGHKPVRGAVQEHGQRILRNHMVSQSVHLVVGRFVDDGDNHSSRRHLNMHTHTHTHTHTFVTHSLHVLLNLI